ncbi:hypothetical protein XENOCAPTIV_003224 [Xenoophorus captivus]|uniref:Uncharacterized protein n=1 Tax=Xenoophorus captivus TaxID=1517983 RepID=A0ABV0Q7S9_9TELE
MTLPPPYLVLYILQASPFFPPNVTMMNMAIHSIFGFIRSQDISAFANGDLAFYVAIGVMASSVLSAVSSQVSTELISLRIMTLASFSKHLHKVLFWG